MSKVRAQMSLQCQNCKAFFKGPISPYQKFVKCPYCKSVINVISEESTVGKKRLLVREVIVEPSKTFEINEFAYYLTRRGVRTFDPVSCILRLGSQQVLISEEGTVEGPRLLKSRVEKWIQKYMSET